MGMRQQVLQAFAQTFGEAPAYLVRAPGRVNLIGDHTDYNLGFALPMAIDRAIWIALRPRNDRRIWLRSMAFDEPAEADLDLMDHGKGWSEYVRGMAWALSAEGFDLQGWEGVLASDVPVGSGLSSSAAIELAIARAFWALGRWDWDESAMAQVAKRHENEWMGLKSGIMDQLISAIGREGQAFLIDFQDLSYMGVPLPVGKVIVVLDTKVERGLVDSAYNARVSECAQAAAHFGVKTLREVTPEKFEVGSVGLDPLLVKRARHVVMENARVLEAVDRMRIGDAVGLGTLMLTSHASLRDDYGVSCPELDAMVRLSMTEPGCYGARMTGAGFGGCAIALVDEAAAEVFCKAVARDYARETGLVPDVYVCRSAEGAKLA